MVAQIDPDRRGRNKTERLAKAMRTLDITAEGFFNVITNEANGGVKSNVQGEEEASIGQITLFKALSKLSRSVADLNPELEGFPFSDDDVLEIMDYLDPNKDGQVTLEEVSPMRCSLLSSNTNNANDTAFVILQLTQSAPRPSHLIADQGWTAQGQGWTRCGLGERVRCQAFESSRGSHD